MRRFIPTTISLAVLTAFAIVPATAQRVDPNRLFDVTLEVNGRMMSAVIREGSSLTLTLNGGGEYRFSAVLDPRGGERVLVSVSRGTPGRPETQQTIERVELTTGRPVSLQSMPSVRIVLDAIRVGGRSSSTGQTAFATFVAATRDPKCCLCCDGVCLCACEVYMWCGACGMNNCAPPLVLPTSTSRTTILTGQSRFAGLTRNTCSRGSLYDLPRTPGGPTRTAMR